MSNTKLESQIGSLIESHVRNKPMKIVRVANESDALHCTQASFIMLWASLTGEILSMQQAEEFTGFTTGVETWPYGMMAWLTEHGCEIIHIDALDAEALAKDPVEELRRTHTPEATIDYFMKISDFESERSRIARALATGRMSFKVRTPEISDIRKGLEDGWTPILFLDYGTLKGFHKDSYQGHVVLITGSTDGEFVVQDPGPPTHWDWMIEDDLLLRSLRYPAETSGTVTLVRMSTGGQ
jgi:hypothetical protein